MIVLSLTVLGFAIADLIRWSPSPVSGRRTACAALGSAAVIIALAWLSGLPTPQAIPIVLGTSTATLIWLLLAQRTFGCRSPGYGLAWVSASLVTAFALSGSTGSIRGPLEHWYAALPFDFAHSTHIDQCLLGVSAALFVLATSNRVVRSVLEATGTPPSNNETTLKGGRVLGPMERLFVGAMVVSGNLTAAAALIAAKGLLRLPEIRSNSEKSSGAGDQVTEYFLIGTFCSLLIASMLGLVVSVAS